MTKRVVFLGSPEFAVPSLRALHNDARIDVRLVISQPDRPTGRGRRLSAPPIAQAASELGLTLFQPETMKQDGAIERVAMESPDALVVVAYGEILTRSMLEIAPHGALNVHPSLLPRYRGSSPIATAILNGDELTGVSIIKLVRRLDAGPIVATHAEAIRADDTAGTLSERLAAIAADVLPDTVSSWIDGALPAVDQDDSHASYTREWTKDDARIDWTRPAVEIERLVRAALPWPVAWTTLDAERIQIREASLGDPASGDALPGAIFQNGKRVLVRAGTGTLQLLVVQPESKRPMPALAWWRNLRDTGVEATLR